MRFFKYGVFFCVDEKRRSLRLLGRDGWYRRFENNGWRLVSDRVIHRLLQTSMDPVTVQTSEKRADFHYSRVEFSFVFLLLIANCLLVVYPVPACFSFYSLLNHFM